MSNRKTFLSEVVEDLEDLAVEQEALRLRISAVKERAKARGLSVKVIGSILKLRKMSEEARAEYEGLLDLYKADLGMLDDALWRRFDLQILVDLPGEDERFAIIRRYLAPFAVSDEEVFALGAALAGASPALLRGFCESLKRMAILGPRMGRIKTLAEVLETLAVSVQPHPDYAPPPFWAEESARAKLVEAFRWRWPLERGGHERP